MKEFIKALVLFTLLIPILSFAQFVPLVGIPGITDASADFDTYINTLYALSISIAALLAVIKIVIAGVKWMTTDVVTTKGDAKKDIQGALVGLLIVLAAVLIITVINPDINDVNLISNLPNSVPDPTAPGTDLPMQSYASIVTSEVGYDWIPYDALNGQRNQFIADCESTGGTIIGDVATNQLRCTALPAATLSTISGYLSGLSTVEIDTAVDQYQNYINPWAITDASTLSEIQSSLGVAQVYFAVDLTAYPAGNPTQFDGVCNAIAKANGDTSGNIQTDYDYSTDQAVCVRIE